MPSDFSNLLNPKPAYISVEIINPHLNPSVPLVVVFANLTAFPHLPVKQKFDLFKQSRVIVLYGKDITAFLFGYFYYELFLFKRRDEPAFLLDKINKV